MTVCFNFWTTTRNLVSVLRKALFQENSLLSWYMIFAIKGDSLLYLTVVFNQSTNECVIELIYDYIKQFATKHRSYLREIRTVYFLHTLMPWAIDLENDVDLIRFLKLSTVMLIVVRSFAAEFWYIVRLRIKEHIICSSLYVHSRSLVLIRTSSER